jgi:hypothetical protein
MNKYIPIILLVIIFNSCTEDKQTEIISVDPTKSKQVSFDELVNDYQLIKLEKPEGIEWGQINIIKKYKDYIFLADRFQTKTITVFDMEGNFIKQLNRAGDSPGDYSNLSLFTFDPVNNALVVYSRMQGVNIYDFETLEIQKEISINERYFMGLEWIASNQYFAIKEYNSSEEEGGFYVLGEDFSEQKELEIPNYNASIEISYPSTISRTDNDVLYNFSSDSSKVYALSENNIEVKHQINFGNSNIDSKAVWNAMESDEFEKEVFENKKATFIQFFRESENGLSFWFINGANEGQNNLAIYDKNTGASKVIRKIYDGEKDVTLDLYPKGILNDQYVTILNPESDLADKLAVAKARKIELGDDYLFVYDLNN